MSEYGYDDPPRRRKSRVRDREPEYVTETTYIQRGPGQPSRDLVFRGREDSIEDIDRDFPPPQAGSAYNDRSSRYRDDYYYDQPRRARSVGRRDHDDYDDGYDHPTAAGAVAGAAAGAYAAGKAKGRRERDDGYYSDDYDRPRRDHRRKSTASNLIEGLGLGSVVGAIMGKASRSRSHSRGRSDRYDRYDSDSDRSTTRSRGGADRANKSKKWQQAATAALIAGATEAYRARKEPNKGTRIATAALASAGLDSFLDRNPNEKNKRHVFESVVGGLAANRLANGPRSKSQDRGRSVSRSRSRSTGGIRGRLRSLSRGVRGKGSESPDSRDSDRGGRPKSRGSGLRDVAALGGVAAVGKAIFDRVRSKSRGRQDRSRSRSRSRSRGRDRSESEDSYVPMRRQRYRENNGKTDRRLATGADGAGDTSTDQARGRGGGGLDDDDASGDGAGGRLGALVPSVKRDASASSVSTTDLENQRRKSRGKELLTAGFATVATIHAAHGVYSSMKASEERHKAVAAGEMSREAARKQKSKNMLQDAAAVGIAALGIKGAFSEWKEMNETRHLVKELEDKRRKKRKKRERRRREEKEMRRLAHGYGLPYGYGAPNPVYTDNNPYAVGNGLPPPPMGAPPARY